MRKLSLILFLFLVNCQTTPAGRPQLILVSKKRVTKESEKLFNQIKQNTSIDSEPDRNHYIKCVVNALTATTNTPFNWEVVAFATDDVKAFALPTKKIGVHTGLLNVAENQDQLAAVMAHEIAHVQTAHARERMSFQRITLDPLSLTSELLQIQKIPILREVFNGIDLGTRAAFLLPFSRQQEFEADNVGLKIMAKAGFDPHESLNFWEKIAKTDQPQKMEWLSTHPSHKSRIKNIKGKLGEAAAIFQSVQLRPKCMDSLAVFNHKAAVLN
jgi:predicted Zn-dependent protease